MEYQSVAIIKDENDSSQMLILNIEKLAETIVIKGNGIEDDKVRESLKLHIPEHTRSLSGSLLGYKTIP